ncbi:MAG: hypothetical protein EOP49_20605 [Sphingobacteriales bacterium]|nr:MAG: hypothetical protein EOP49_20605 [Sphingobacteriales bacterium]
MFSIYYLPGLGGNGGNGGRGGTGGCGGSPAFGSILPGAGGGGGVGCSGTGGGVGASGGAGGAGFGVSDFLHPPTEKASSAIQSKCVNFIASDFCQMQFLKKRSDFLVRLSEK